MRRFFVLIAFLVILLGCTHNNKEKIDISAIDVNVDVERFEEKFYTSNEVTLTLLKQEFPFLFPEQTPDSIWLQRIMSEDEKKLFNKSQTIFADFNNEINEIKQLFKYYKYYYPTFNEPKIITLINNLDYESKVIYTGEFLFISLDMYLGSNDEVYESFPSYLSNNFKKERIVVDIAEKLSGSIQKTRNRQFIDIMINKGKQLYLMNAILPEISDELLMGYTKDKMVWAVANEEEVWRYFIDNKLLYSTDSNLQKRFIANGPFSKFYMDIEKDSPGRIGVWMGWQIVKAYMKNNSVTLQQMMEVDADEIFKKSKYKPKK
jgi:gliding motility-associated lipoprotein GldB